MFFSKMNKDRLDTKTNIDIEMTGGNIHAKALQGSLDRGQS
ncbi:hypothetical protein B4107_1125 [Bacillus safensis]|nr:hypothetical protein B4107_1125 [Bacillus safensis]